MAEYLTEAVYMRWFRQYQISLGYYMDLLDHLKLRLDSLPMSKESEAIQNHIDEIDKNLEKVIPRVFTAHGKPLRGFEILSENLKVMVNLIVRLLGRPDPFPGVYHEEKIRVLKIHQGFKFKEQLKAVRESIETLETKHKEKSEPENMPENEIMAEQQQI